MKPLPKIMKAVVLTGHGDLDKLQYLAIKPGHNARNHRIVRYSSQTKPYWDSLARLSLVRWFIFLNSSINWSQSNLLE